MSAEPRRYRLLFVEDDEIDRIGVVRGLRRLTREFEICEAEDITSGIRNLDNDPFDCILVDYRLPDGTALDFIDRIKAHLENIPPIIVLTGHDDEKTALEVLQHGAQDYLVKPPKPQELARAIRYAIERTHAQDLQRRLVHAERLASIGKLAAGVAHEINNPATYILFNFDVVQTNVQRIRDTLAALPPDLSGPQILEKHGIAEFLDKIHQAAGQNREGMERIRQVVRDLRDYARTGDNETEPVDLNRVVDTACNITANQIRHQAQLLKECRPVANVLADDTKLTQVAVNLLLNAVQALDSTHVSQHQITVRTFQDADTVFLSVQDTGPGISKEHLEKIFDPFFTTKPKTGSGLGLSICRDILREYRGQLRVDSEVGGGSTFTVELPRYEAKSRRRSSSSIPQQRPAVAPRRILLVDDEPLVRRVYRRMLEPPHEVVEAGGGNAALDIVQKDSQFDVIFCDLMMPDLDGPSFFEALKEQQAKLTSRVVFVTGGAFSERATQFISHTSNLVLEKPTTPQLVWKAIDKITQTSRPSSSSSFTA